ncbi:hypothetical protein [Nocardioides sp. GXZ039]|uniref:hypothetical protein n=1 Tax=Nocardioides sp. GXZ039 TaxID=3136018 RepID=UPI0030F4892F
MTGPTVDVRLDSDDLDSLVVELAARSDESGPAERGVVGLNYHGQHGRIELGPIRYGETRCLPVSRTGPVDGHPVRVRGTARRGEDEWPLFLETSIPRDPRRFTVR